MFFLSSSTLLLFSITILLKATTVFMIDSTAKDSCKPNPNTYYTIANPNGTKLIVEASEVKSKPTESSGDEIKWYFEQHQQHEGTLVYSIKSKLNNLALTVSKGSLENGTSFELATYEKKPEQRFLLIRTEGGCLIVASHAKMLMTAGDQDKVVQQQPTKHDQSQLWVFEQTCDPVPYQSYRLVHVQSKKIMGVSPAYNKNWLPEIVLYNEEETSDYTLFQFVPKGKETYSIFIKRSNKVLNIRKKNTYKGARVIEHPMSNSTNELFSLQKSTNGYCMIKGVQSGRFLAPSKINDEIAKVGSIITLNEETEIESQLWKLEPFGWIPDENTAYQIKNKFSGKCMDIEDGSKENEAFLIQWDCDATKQNQQFYLKRDQDSASVYRLINKNSGKALDAQNSTDSPKPVIQLDASAMDWQKFQLVPSVDSKHWRILALHKDGLVLALLDEKADNKVKITTMQINDSTTSQEWEIVAEK